MMGRMEEEESFEIIPSSHKAGQPASALPGLLREAVASSMKEVEAVVEESRWAEANTEARTPLSEDASELRQAFFGCFMQYGQACSGLWDKLAAVAAAPEASERGGPSRDAKLLVLQSNCVHLRTHVLKDMAARFAELLEADGARQEVRRLYAECAEDMKAVEARLARSYVAARLELLNDILEEYFEDDGTDWPQAPLPSGLRDSTYEIVNALVAVQAEVYSHSLSLQRRVMDELLQHLFTAYATCLSEKLKGISAGGALQLLLEVQYLGGALGPALRHSREQLLEQLKEQLLAAIDGLAGQAGGAAEADLDAWCETIQGGSMGGRAEMATKFIAAGVMRATRLNVVGFKA